MFDFFKARKRRNEPVHNRFQCHWCGAEWGEKRHICTACGAVNSIIAVPLDTPEDGKVTGPKLRTAAELRRRRTVQRWSLGSELEAWLGKLPRRFHAMAWGAPGGGKSTLLTILADAMSRAVDGPVLYVAAEEGQGDAVVQRLQRTEVVNDNLWISGAMSWREINHDVNEVDDLRALFLDSYSAARITEAQLAALAERIEVPLWFSVHATKGGQAGGPAALEHWVDLVARVEGGVARTTKNRFGALGEYRIFGSPISESHDYND